jgi:hypothetical protein
LSFRSFVFAPQRPGRWLDEFAAFIPSLSGRACG